VFVMADSGWWDAGRFWIPVWRRVEGVNFATGFMMNATAAGNEAEAVRKAALAHANMFGLEETIKAMPRTLARLQ